MYLLLHVCEMSFGTVLETYKQKVFIFFKGLQYSFKVSQHVNYNKPEVNLGTV